MVRPRSRRSRALVTAGALLALAMAPAARAANIFENVGAGEEFLVDLSPRSLAMGGASGAVFWGQGLNHWANPALLGLLQGIAYEDATRENLLSEGRAQRWTLGGGGLGLATAGRPFTGLGGVDTFGGPFGNEIRSWGIGASLAGIAASIAELRGQGAPAFTRYADLAAGYNRKTTNWGFGALGRSEAVGVDWGVLARGAAPFRLGSEGARAEAAYAYAVQNANDGVAAGAGLRYNRPHRHSVAARVALDVPSGLSARLPAWFVAGLEPIVSVGGAWDREFFSIGTGPTFEDESHLGGELGLANVAFLRIGNDDVRHSWGYGLALPLGRLAGFQFDETHLGAVGDFPETTSHAWRVWVAPNEIARALRAPGR